MLYPPMSELLEHIDSRYLLVNVVARRARQIAIEAKEFGEPSNYVMGANIAGFRKVADAMIDQGI